MSDHTETAMDYDEHQRSYALFIGLAKWTAILVVITLILMAIFLV